MKKLFSLILLGFLLTNLTYAAQLEEELVFNTERHFRVDSNTKNDEWRDTGDVGQALNIILKDKDGNVIKVYNELDLEEGDKIPSEIFDAVKTHYNKDTVFIRYNGESYKANDVFVKDDVVNIVKNKGTIILVGYAKIELVKNNSPVDGNCTVSNLGSAVDHYGAVVTINNDIPIDGLTLYIKYTINAGYISGCTGTGTSTHCSVGYSCRDHQWWQRYGGYLQVSGTLGGFNMSSNETTTKDIAIAPVRSITVDGTTYCTESYNHGGSSVLACGNTCYHRFTVNIQEAYLE